MKMMRDVDFLFALLTDGPLPLERALIYRYRSGVLRPRVLAALRAVAERQGDRLGTGKLPLRPGFAENSLYGGLMCHDWPARTSIDLSEDALRLSLARLAESVHRPSVHFVQHGSPIGRHPSWNLIEQDAHVIEEPLVTSECLLPILRYLAASTDLAPKIDVINQAEFVKSFASSIEDGAGLPEIIQAFDERVLLCTDVVTSRYDDAYYRRDLVRRWGKWVPLPHLRNLMALRQECDLVDLLIAFDERRAERSFSPFKLTADLYSKSSLLLEPMTESLTAGTDRRSRVSVERIEEGAVLWAALVLACEDRFVQSMQEEADGYRRGPDLFVPALAALGQNFLAREDKAESGDPLAGLWADVACTLKRCGTGDSNGGTDRLETVRSKLVYGLEAALTRSMGRVAWMRRLHKQVLAARGHLNDMVDYDEASIGTRVSEVCLPELPPSFRPRLPAAFDEVVGRKHAVSGLRRHVLAQADGVDLLLHGPEGVGKLTLARIYARALLCEVPTLGGSGCGICASCCAFASGHPGYFELDGANEAIERQTRTVVEVATKGSLFADKLVFVIRNADRYPPEVFDKLLKSMESSSRANFVLLARDGRNVRVAGQSRCFDYRVRPLNRAEAEAFLRDVLAARCSVCDEAVLALLIDAGGGLPKRLLRACEIVSGTVPTSLDAIRSKLDLDWAEGLVSRWHEIVAAESDELTDLTTLPGVDLGEQVRRVQAVLQWIYLRGIRDVSSTTDAIDSALEFLDDACRAEFVAALDGRAVGDGAIIEAVWARMAELWMSDARRVG